MPRKSLSMVSITCGANNEDSETPGRTKTEVQNSEVQKDMKSTCLPSMMRKSMSLACVMDQCGNCWSFPAPAPPSLCDDTPPQTYYYPTPAYYDPCYGYYTPPCGSWMAGPYHHTFSYPVRIQ